MMNLETILVQHGAKVIMMIVHGKLVKVYLEEKHLQGSRQCLSQKFKPLGQKEFLLITCENNLSGKVERIPPSSPWMPYWMMVSLFILMAKKLVDIVCLLGRSIIKPMRALFFHHSKQRLRRKSLMRILALCLFRVPTLLL